MTRSIGGGGSSRGVPVGVAGEVQVVHGHASAPATNPTTSPHASNTGSSNITSRPASDVVVKKSSLTDDYNRTNDRLSEHIPTRTEISQKVAEVKEIHPDDPMFAAYEKTSTLSEMYVPGDVRTAGSNFVEGGYDAIQEDPLKAGLIAASMLPVGAAFRAAGGISKAVGLTGAVQSIPLIGGGVAKYGAGALIGGVYAVDINERVNEPVFTGYNQTVETNATHIITTDTPTYRDPTLGEKAYRFGGITSTEILPMVAGAGVYGKLTAKKNVVVTDEVIVDPVRKFEVIEGIKQTTTKTAGSSRTTTNINTEIVPEGNIRPSEINRFQRDLAGKSERILEVNYRYSESIDGVTHSSQGTGPVTLKKNQVIADQFTLTGQRNTYIKKSDWMVRVDPAKPTDPVRPIETFGTKRTTNSDLDLILREKVKEPEFFRPDTEMEIFHFRGRPRGEIVKDTTSNLGGGQQFLNDYSLRVKSDVRPRDTWGNPEPIHQPNTADIGIKTNFGTGKQSGQLDNIMHSNSGSGVGMDASLGPMQQSGSPQPILQPTLKRNTGITAEQIMGELPPTQQVVTSQHTVQIPGQKFTPMPMQTDLLGSRQVQSVISNIQPMQSDVMVQTPIMDFMKPSQQKQAPIFGVRSSSISTRTMFDQQPIQGQKPVFIIKQQPIQGHPPIMDSILKTRQTPMFAERSILDIGRIGGARSTQPAPPIPVVALPSSGGLGGMGGGDGGDWNSWGSRKKRHNVKDPFDFLMG